MKVNQASGHGAKLFGSGSKLAMLLHSAGASGWGIRGNTRLSKIWHPLGLVSPKKHHEIRSSLNWVLLPLSLVLGVVGIGDTVLMG